MNNRRKILEHLKKHGFKFLRQGKHEIWTDGERNIPIPRGNGVSNRTLKSCDSEYRGKRTFLRKE